MKDTIKKVLRRTKEVWLDLTNQTDDRGFTKQMRIAKRKLDKLHKKSTK